MPNNFQPGDKVRCTDPSDPRIEEGGLYTVGPKTDPAGRMLLLHEVEGWFHYGQFEPVTSSRSTMEPGDQVLCVDASGHMLLRRGLVYTVSDERSELDNMFYVEGVEEPVLRERFVPHVTSGEALAEFERPAREAYEEHLGKYKVTDIKVGSGGSAEDTEEIDFMSMLDEYSKNNDYADAGFDPAVETYLRRYDRFGTPITTHLLRDGVFASIADIIVLGVESDSYEHFMEQLLDLRKHALAQFEAKRDKGGFDVSTAPEPKELVNELWQVVFGYERPEQESPKQTWENLLEHIADLLGPEGLQEWRTNLDNAQRSIDEAHDLLATRDDIINRMKAGLADALGMLDADADPEEQAVPMWLTMTAEVRDLRMHHDLIKKREKHFADANVDLHDRLRSLALYTGTAAYGDTFVLNNSDDMVKVLKDAIDQLIGSDD